MRSTAVTAVQQHQTRTMWGDGHRSVYPVLWWRVIPVYRYYNRLLFAHSITCPGLGTINDQGTKRYQMKLCDIHQEMHPAKHW